MDRMDINFPRVPPQRDEGSQASSHKGRDKSYKGKKILEDGQQHGQERQIKKPKPNPKVVSEPVDRMEIEETEGPMEGVEHPTAGPMRGITHPQVPMIIEDPHKTSDRPKRPRNPDKIKSVTHGIKIMNLNDEEAVSKKRKKMDQPHESSERMDESD